MRIFNYLYKTLEIVLSKLFSTTKSLEYIIFDFFFKKKILERRLNKNYKNNEVINSFVKDGFCKINNFRNFSKNLNDELKKENPKIEKFVKKFSITPNLQEKIREFCNKDIKDLLNDLNNLYGSKIFLAGIKIAENFSYDGKEDVYANKFHVDNNRLTLFKIFVLLSDVNENSGPTNIVKLTDTKKFKQEINFKNRYNYNETYNDKLIYKNTGNIGDILICSTSRCLHKAGVVSSGISRTMLTLTFVSYPYNEEQDDHFYFIDKNKSYNQYNNLSKSKTILDNFRIFFKYLANVKKLN